MHYPTLTVRQTLEFALSCHINNAGYSAPTKEIYKDAVLKMLIRIFGLGRCQDTIVGNELIRGISGGERKRLSIAEQVAAGAEIGIWDGSTKGLDASSALEFVRALKSFTDILKKSAICSFYQTSDSMYRLFDRVMVSYYLHFFYILLNII